MARCWREFPLAAHCDSFAAQIIISERDTMRTILLACAAVFALAGCGSSGGEAAQDATAKEYSARQYQTAVADIARPEADRAQDAARKPGELLAFAEIDPGEKVGDYIMGGGYVTRLLATAVGFDGKVYAFQPDEFIAFRPEYAKEQDEAVAPYADEQGNHVRVVPLRGPVTAPPFPEPLDTIVTVMNLHDLYIGAMPEGTGAKAIAALYAALKPGGTLVVVDHSARDGSGTSDTDKLHRIDRQAAIDALTAAGFVLESESDLYRRPDDPRTANVFDPSIRGKTDQFALRLRKPA
jgi:predicted methyltransferase